MNSVAILSAVEEHMDRLDNYNFSQGKILACHHDYMTALKELPSAQVDFYNYKPERRAFVFHHAGKGWEVNSSDSVARGTFIIQTIAQP